MKFKIKSFRDKKKFYLLTFSAMVFLLIGGGLFGKGLITNADANSSHEFTLETVDPAGATVANQANIVYRARVNINDAAAQNVRIVLTATNGVFDSLPGICKTSDVTPVSAISTDGKILTCNTGDWQHGSSFRIDIIVRANGPNNSQVNLIATQTSDGRSDIVRNGDPKTITADFRSDFGIYGGNTYNYYTSGANTPYSIENVGYAIPIYWRVALKPIQRE